MQHGLHTAETASERLSIVPLTPDRYAEWDEFCRASPDAWFWHTSQWLEYTLHYRPDLQPRCESFFCLHQGAVVAICPLISRRNPRQRSHRHSRIFAGRRCRTGTRILPFPS